MKSGKQRRAEIMAARRSAKLKREFVARLPAMYVPKGATAAVDTEKFAPYCSCCAPLFVSRGFYEDEPFRCRDCGLSQVWTAVQQKWWFEEAQGNLNSQAVRCKACREKERERITLARKTWAEGLARKAIRKAMRNINVI